MADEALAVDAPPMSPPTMSVLGPTLAPLELAASKLLALFGRAEARDFADVYALARRFDKDTLLTHAAPIDPGFDARVLAEMLTTLDRFHDKDIPADPNLVPALRAYFSTWAAELHE